jgi:hypothetical protein
VSYVTIKISFKVKESKNKLFTVGRAQTKYSGGSDMTTWKVANELAGNVDFILFRFLFISRLNLEFWGVEKRQGNLMNWEVLF